MAIHFTYSIQKVDFFVDQVEDKGDIDLDGAIDAFQNFPFPEQLKQARERELTSCLPTISFKSDDGRTLAIWAEDDKGFSLQYDNGTKASVFFLSNNFYETKDSPMVEDYIIQFFSGTIEQSIELEDINTEYKKHSLDSAAEKPLVTFSFNDTNKIKKYVWTIAYFLLAMLLLITDIQKKEIVWGFQIVFSFFWLPGTIVHVSYWFKNKNATITVDSTAKTLKYEKNGQKVKFNRNEILVCELNEPRSGGGPWGNYCYLWFILKDNRKIVITNFITEPENIIKLLKLNYRTDKRTIPFLPI
jgi:hypothetical protein